MDTQIGELFPNTMHDRVIFTGLNSAQAQAGEV